MPILHSHTHCQAAQTSRTSQSLSKSVSEPTHGGKKIKKRGTIAIKHALRDTFHSGTVIQYIKANVLPGCFRAY